jgi:hypothetical protein
MLPEPEETAEQHDERAASHECSSQDEDGNDDLEAF